MRDSPVPWILRAGTLMFLLALGWSAGLVLRSPKANAWTRQGTKLRVLTTIYPLYDFAREMGGSDVEVRNLLPPGVDPHEYALSPRDVALVDRADLIIANGVGLDDFLTNALSRTTRQRRVITATEGIVPMAGGDDDHGHGAGDPHMWLDPAYARHYALIIGREMAAELKGKGQHEAAERVENRAAEMDSRLVVLDAEYRKALVPYRGSRFIAFHGAVAYLAQRYGLEIAAVWQPTPGREPGPREVGKLIELARARSVKALLSEPQFSPRALDMIAHDSRLPVYQLDPFETSRDFDSAHYVPVMRANLDTLVRALSR